jgi:hypothetical protein
MNRLSRPISASSFGSSPSLGCAAEDMNPFTGKTRWVSKDLFESELVPWLRLNDHRHRVADLRPGITLAGHI